MKHCLAHLKELADRRSHAPRALFVVPPTFIADYFNDDRHYSDGVAPNADQVRVADELGYICANGLMMPYLHDAAQYDAAVRWDVRSWVEGDTMIVKRAVETPHGLLWHQDRWPLEDTSGAHHKLKIHDKKIIQTAQDVKAYHWYIATCARVLLDHRQSVIADIVAKCKAENQRWADRMIPVWHCWMPHDHVVFGTLEQDDGILFMHEYPEQVHELCELAMDVVRLWTEAAVAAKFQALQTAIWGYEIFSPALHDEFVFEYAQEYCDRAHQAGLISWVHCCGKLKGVIERGFYQKMGVDMLECLNYPPCGDITDWRASRALLGDAIITKGNIEDSLLLNGPIGQVKDKTKGLLDEEAGFRHFFSSANGFFPDTPVGNVRAMMEVVNNYERRASVV